MLSLEDNELITRVGRGTPMGDLLRRFWIPVLLSWELEADGSPERVRLLGEDLLAFRDSSGRVGMIDERCPHRRASLYFGRNEQDGLRCIYHGWKIDVAGQCVDMPSEPPDPSPQPSPKRGRGSFKDKVRVKSYPVAEACGVVWAYMGQRETPPPLPGLEWLRLPESHAVFSKRVQYCNWLQGLEGDIDQSHLSFTHSRLRIDDGQTGPGGSSLVDQIRKLDTHPQFELLDREYGTLIGAGRRAPDSRKYWRVTQHLMPFHTMTGPYGEDPLRNWRAWVPIDDENVYVIGCAFHPRRPLTEQERDSDLAPRGTWTISPEMRAPRTSAPFGRWRPLAGLENDFFQDRGLQKKETYSGIREFWAQDAAPQLSMGRIADRSEERLGTSDLAIIAVRRRLLREARALADDAEEPAEVDTPDVYRIRSDAVLIPADESWIEATEERRRVIAGVNPACP